MAAGSRLTIPSCRNVHTSTAISLSGRLETDGLERSGTVCTQAANSAAHKIALPVFDFGLVAWEGNQQLHCRIGSLWPTLHSRFRRFGPFTTPTSTACTLLDRKKKPTGLHADTDDTKVEGAQLFRFSDRAGPRECDPPVVNSRAKTRQPDQTGSTLSGHIHS